MTADELMDLMKERYSARSFTDEPVTEAELAAILEVARTAPSAKNNQPWRLYVAQTPEGLARVDACSPCRYNAPCVIFICYDRSVAASTPIVEDFGLVDCSLAMMQMSLMAQALGLGTCMVGMVDPVKARAEFNVPEGIVPFEMLMVGHPVPEKSGPSPRHTERAALEDIVIEYC